MCTGSSSAGCSVPPHLSVVLSDLATVDPVVALCICPVHRALVMLFAVLLLLFVFSGGGSMLSSSGSSGLGLMHFVIVL